MKVDGALRIEREVHAAHHAVEHRGRRAAVMSARALGALTPTNPTLRARVMPAAQRAHLEAIARTASADAQAGGSVSIIALRSTLGADVARLDARARRATPALEAQARGDGFGAETTQALGVGLFTGNARILPRECAPRAHIHE